MTDIELKQALARMLPEKVYFDLCMNKLYYKGEIETEISDTELLHLCWLIEETLTPEEANNIELKLLHGILATDDIYKRCWHASWQQRVIALMKLKNLK